MNFTPLLLVIAVTMVDAKKILFVMTNADRMGPDHPTGQYLPEFAHPYNILSKEHEIVFASPKGGAVPIDPSSRDLFKADQDCNAFLANKGAMKAISETAKLSDLRDKAKMGEFAAIFFPGGHGPMVDLTNNAEANELTRIVYENGGIAVGVCHGVCGLTDVKLSGGELLIKSKRITGFSNAEEEAVGLTKKVPYLLEDLIKERGGKYEKAPELWGVRVVSDSRVLTGQNPSSSMELGKTLLKMLNGLNVKYY